MLARQEDCMFTFAAFISQSMLFLCFSRGFLFAVFFFIILFPSESILNRAECFRLQHHIKRYFYIFLLRWNGFFPLMRDRISILGGFFLLRCVCALLHFPISSIIISHIALIIIYFSTPYSSILDILFSLSKKTIKMFSNIFVYVPFSWMLWILSAFIRYR